MTQATVMPRALLPVAGPPACSQQSKIVVGQRQESPPANEQLPKEEPLRQSPPQSRHAPGQAATSPAGSGKTGRIWYNPDRARTVMDRCLAERVWHNPTHHAE